MSGWRLQPIVRPYWALLGAQFNVATPIAAELGNITRFDTPRQLAAYVGLGPSEYPSGCKRQNIITAAIGWEMLAFMWTIAKKVQIAESSQTALAG